MIEDLAVTMAWIVLGISYISRPPEYSKKVIIENGWIIISINIGAIKSVRGVILLLAILCLWRFQFHANPWVGLLFGMLAFVNVSIPSKRSES